MFKSLQILLFGNQPIPNITDRQLSKLIDREFGSKAGEVKYKLKQVDSDTGRGRNRISAAIIRLANKNLNAVDHYIELSRQDFRDIIMQGEYPRCLQLGMTDIARNDRKRIYLEDWKDYYRWLRAKS